MRSMKCLIHAVCAVIGLGASSPAIGQTLLVSYSSGSTIERYSLAGADVGTFTSALASGGSVNTPTGMAVDGAGNVYIANSTGFGGIQKFSSTGTDLGAFYIGGFLNLPYGLAFDGSGNLFVALAGDNTIAKISPAGSLVTTFGTAGLNGPFGLAIDLTGNVYVANSGGNAIEKFSSAGSYLGQFATANLSSPSGLAFAPNGNLFVANSNGGTVVQFTAGGGYVTQFSTGLGSLGGLTIGDTVLYVTSTSLDVTGKFSLAGAPLGTIPGNGLTSPQFAIVAIPEPVSAALLVALGAITLGISRRAIVRRT